MKYKAVMSEITVNHVMKITVAIKQQVLQQVFVQQFLHFSEQF